MRPACSTLAILAVTGWALLAESGVLVPKRVWSGPEVTLLGGVSRDGRFLSYVDPSSRNLAIHEIASGKNRILTRAPAGSGEFGYFSAISPDSLPSSSRGDGRSTQEHQNNDCCTKNHGENPEHKHEA